MKRNKLFSIPYIIWMALFVVAPIVLVVLYAFTAADGGFTFANFTRMGNYFGVFVRSFWLALIATAICLVIGYPIAYLISKESKRFQRISMALIMLPMWMNFLLRTYAWMSILENTGLLNRFFSAIGLIDLVNGILGTNMTHFNMINTPGAVVLGMVYNFLPFMILPIHSVIQKIDRNLIEIQFLGSAYNPHLGSAISLVMMLVVVICMAVMNRFGEGEETAVML